MGFLITKTLCRPRHHFPTTRIRGIGRGHSPPRPRAGRHPAASRGPQVGPAATQTALPNRSDTRRARPRPGTPAAAATGTYLPWRSRRRRPPPPAPRSRSPASRTPSAGSAWPRPAAPRLRPWAALPAAAPPSPAGPARWAVTGSRREADRPGGRGGRGRGRGAGWRRVRGPCRRGPCGTGGVDEPQCVPGLRFRGRKGL